MADTKKLVPAIFLLGGAKSVMAAFTGHFRQPSTSDISTFAC
ncbi:hypothetical protein L248_2530 [Schleiferilactobacillus shenzhenensis LY-73]|uniref:Uncharacterized protein n=1 Tax=Schleiferilactobacillus shenzhenensis LY-73 TaxID=1231336 RepID=U4TVM9_9LACO|nr:hypothetical protein L248_2530 [Schleiferilactobacillus shenzhenensis LY-73]